MLLPDVQLSYFHYVCKHNLFFVCTDVIMQTMLFSEFTDFWQKS